MAVDKVALLLQFQMAPEMVGQVVGEVHKAVKFLELETPHQHRLHRVMTEAQTLLQTRRTKVLVVVVVHQHPAGMVLRSLMELLMVEMAGQDKFQLFQGHL
jgi:hypothetical protein